MKEKLRVAGFLESSVSDGPGVRSVLFFQGCSRGCPGCHNKELQGQSGGMDASVQELVQFLLDTCPNRKLTLSGGEPLEQYPLLRDLMQELFNSGFDLCLYTGYGREEVPKDLFPYLHYLKVGDYRQELRDLTLHYVGSRNQKLIDLQKEMEEQV